MLQRAGPVGGIVQADGGNAQAADADPSVDEHKRCLAELECPLSAGPGFRGSAESGSISQ